MPSKKYADRYKRPKRLQKAKPGQQAWTRRCLECREEMVVPSPYIRLCDRCRMHASDSALNRYA